MGDFEKLPSKSLTAQREFGSIPFFVVVQEVNQDRVADLAVVGNRLEIGQFDLAQAGPIRPDYKSESSLTTSGRISVRRVRIIHVHLIT